MTSYADNKEEDDKMRILHFYQSSAGLIAQHVETLCRQMGLSAENLTATHQQEALQLLRGQHFDVLHLHGCWYTPMSRVARVAQKQGTRLVLTPHGELEPWVMKEQYWKEKIPKKWLYQRVLVSQAYAVVVQGGMEEECLHQLQWNERLTVIRNSLITHSITSAEMARQTFLLYRKVMDSNVLELMDDQMRQVLRSILKAGITGDHRWLSGGFEHSLSDEDWRRLLLYAHQEHISETLAKGIRVLQLQTPDLNTEKTEAFYPEDYQPPKSIQQQIGNQFATENERLVATFQLLRRLIFHRQLTISHIVELDHELRHHDAEEEQLAETLRERHLYTTACRMMQILRELTELDEGFMPVPPKNDRITRQISKIIVNHLKI